MSAEPTYQWDCPSCGKRYQILSGKCPPERCPECVKRVPIPGRLNSLFAVAGAATAKQPAISDDVQSEVQEPRFDSDPVKWACPKCGDVMPLALKPQDGTACAKCQAEGIARATEVAIAPKLDEVTPGLLAKTMLVIGTLISIAGVLAGFVTGGAIAEWFIFGAVNVLIYEVITLRQTIQTLRDDLQSR